MFGVVAVLPWSPAMAEFCSVGPLANVHTSDGPDGSILMPVTLNGAAGEATLDTGAPVSVMRESVAEQFGFKRWPIPLDAVTGVAGRPFEEGTLVQTVGIDKVTVDNVPFLIAPRTHAGDARSLGLIGADVFARFDVLLDLGDDRIAFFPPGQCRPENAFTLAAIIAPSHHVYVDLELDGERVRALVDSGASRSVMTLGTAHRLFGLDPGSAGVRPVGTMMSADGGSVLAYGHAFKALALGETTLSTPDILLMPDETHRLHHVITPGLQEAEGLPDMVLGLTELRRLRLMIAYGAKQLLVQARSGP